MKGLPGGPMVENLHSNAEDTGLIPGQGARIPVFRGNSATSTEPSVASR